LRYIAKGQWRLTRDSVRERQRLLDEAPGLVEPMSFMMPHYRGGFPGPRVLGGLLSVYDALAGRRSHRFHDAQQLRYLAPGLKEHDLQGGTCFVDALTDDARLVMRVLSEARADGGVVLNGVRVEQLLREEGRVCGVQVQDCETGTPLQLRCGVLAVATGAWAERLRPSDAPRQLRPLRGSHLLLPGWRLPVAQAFTFLHERDRRPVFVFPWEGATVVGTTDLDHQEDLDQSASISLDELDYLLAACTQQFPGAGIVAADVLSTWSGVRPVVGSAAAELKPSNETREHVLWQEPGCVTLAGGKLTTFRPQAIEVLKACAGMLGRPFNDDAAPVFAEVPMLAIPQLSASQWRRMAGRHGRDLPRLAKLLAELGPGSVGNTDTLWAELAFACDTEMVLHLDDLLLRRTRLGLLLARGGEEHFAAIRRLCQPRLGWDDERWQHELQQYRALWQRHHGLPDATP
jgi:glycerol-3-phosphate dehydrogenase